MKTYRKRLIGMILAMIFCFSPVSVMAAEFPVTISSGLNMNAEEVENTFEEERIVYGEAAPGTKVIFTVSKLNRFGEKVEMHRDEVRVGSLGLFSVTLPLERGNNYIDMTVGGETQQTVVKHVPRTVKTQLQRMIALPGLNVAFK
ncbi:MAG: hypothetical protein IKT73_01670 [Anaerotignum sp.]|nr:hypothetical protein [Anaerotignum sp.]MBR6541893.1 hypothetical protein [Anaerotignum sp.]